MQNSGRIPQTARLTGQLTPRRHVRFRGEHAPSIIPHRSSLVRPGALRAFAQDRHQGRSYVAQHRHVEALQMRDAYYQRTGKWYSREDWEQWIKARDDRAR